MSNRCRIVALAILFCLPATSWANLSHICFFTSVDSGTGFGSADPSVPWFSSGATVDIYYSSEQIPGGPDYRPWTAVGVTEAQFQQVVLKAVGTWNEQSGSRIRLRYKGSINSTSYVCDQSLGQQCAVIITGDELSCPTSDTATSYPGLDTAHKFKQGNIVFHYQNRDNNPSGPCNPITWFLTSGYDTDLTRALIHELGHTVFAIGHPSDLSMTSDCTQYDPYGNALYSVMSGVNEHDGRNLKNWDKEIAQLRYGTRSSTAQIMRSGFVSSAWHGSQLTGTGSTHALYRADSMTQSLTNRMIGWVDGGTSLNQFGFGINNAAEYAAGLHNQSNSFPSGNEPVALASQQQSVTSPEVLLAYKKEKSTSDGYDDDRKLICFRTSTNYGSTWNAETCGTSSQTSSTYGMTAAYNEGASAFVIPWVDNAGFGDQIAFFIQPVFGFLYQTHVSIYSPSQPAIACKPGTNTCLVVYAVDDSAGSMGWFTITIDPTTYAVTASSPSTAVTTMDEIVGIMYDVDNSAYRIARAEKASAVYSYIQNFFGSWTGTGDIWNNSGGTTQVSGAAMSGRAAFSLATKPYAFFEVYF